MSAAKGAWCEFSVKAWAAFRHILRTVVHRSDSILKAKGNHGSILNSERMT